MLGQEAARTVETLLPVPGTGSAVSGGEGLLLQELPVGLSPTLPFSHSWRFLLVCLEIKAAH